MRTAFSTGSFFDVLEHEEGRDARFTLYTYIERVLANHGSAGAIPLSGASILHFCSFDSCFLGHSKAVHLNAFPFACAALPYDVALVA